MSHIEIGHGRKGPKSGSNPVGFTFLDAKSSQLGLNLVKSLHFRSNRGGLLFWSCFCRGRSAGENLFELRRTAEKFLRLVALQPGRHAVAFLCGTRDALS